MKLSASVLAILTTAWLVGCRSPCEKGLESEAAGDLAQASMHFSECEGPVGQEGMIRVAMADADAHAPIGLKEAARLYKAAQAFPDLVEPADDWVFRHVPEIEQCQGFKNATDWSEFNDAKAACVAVTGEFDGTIGVMAGAPLTQIGNVEGRLLKDAGIGKPAKAMESYLRERVGMGSEKSGTPTDVLWSDGKAHNVSATLWKCGSGCYDNPYMVQKDTKTGVLLGLQHVLKLEQEEVAEFLGLATGGTAGSDSTRWVVGTATPDLRRTGARQEKNYSGYALTVGRSGKAEWVTVTLR